ncbi:hypothetical protein KIH41_03320 [Litoribacter ruber]|uniref:Uncharacterized protein n=1 Tax=Litoribacter ruber TaxID=702568 RepID=A0AAP2CH18_9BACT|nr:hypothetical protein [Litoribacter ruber]MBS9524538.1 hypothetical protein [Litoribacter alkaliphilus]MBT0810302.1 hypothetical protein [Litoribacter ruber]
MSKINPLIIIGFFGIGVTLCMQLFLLAFYDIPSTQKSFMAIHPIFATMVVIGYIKDISSKPRKKLMRK